MKITAAALQAQGPRSRQEDAILCEPDEGVFGVFDGLGGHPNGDKASAGAARLLLQAWRDGGRPLIPGKLDAVWSKAVLDLDAVLARGDTTATVGWLAGEQLIVLHSGDCSLLRWRKGEVDNLVKRHGWGNIVANTFRRRSETSAPPDIEHVHLAPSDVLVFATDGLDVLTHDAVEALLSSLSPGPDLPARAASLLVSAALASGTNDNVSVVVLYVHEPNHPRKEPNMAKRPPKSPLPTAEPTQDPALTQEAAVASDPEILPPLAEVIASEPDLAQIQQAIHDARPPAEQDALAEQDAAPVEMERAADVEVAHVTQGTLITGAQQAHAEKLRRLEEHRAQMAQELLGLPLLTPAKLDADLEPEEALEVLAGSVWPCHFGGSSLSLTLDFAYRDAESGSHVGATASIKYDPNTKRVTREALLVWLVALRRSRLTSEHAANLIGQTLWALLAPAKLAVTVKPARLQEAAAWKRDDGEGCPVYDLTEELLRVALALRVPAMIERIRAKGGPDPVDLEGAGEKAVKLVDKLKGGAHSLTGEDGLLSTACHAVAYAAFIKGGIRVLGQHFEVKGAEPAPLQTDFEDYASKRAQAKSADGEPMIPVSAARRAALRAVEFAEKLREQEQGDEFTLTDEGKVRVSPATVVEAAAQAREEEASKMRAERPGDSLTENMAALLEADAARIRREGQAQFGVSQFARKDEVAP